MAQGLLGLGEGVEAMPSWKQELFLTHEVYLEHARWCSNNANCKATQTASSLIFSRLFGGKQL